MLPWYLLDASDSSLCIVNEKNIIQAGQGIEVDDKVRFFYEGKEYEGVVLAKSDDITALQTEMKTLLKAPRKKSNPAPTLSSSNTKSKRLITTPQFYGSSSQTVKKLRPNKAPALSEEEESRQRILQLNKKTAEKNLNSAILAKLAAPKPKKNYDPDWTDEDSMDSTVDARSHNLELKNCKRDIIKNVTQDSPNKDSCQDSPNRNSCHDNTYDTPSPSKEDLKKELDLLRKQLMKDSASMSGTSNSAKKDDGTNKKQSMRMTSHKDGKKQLNPLGSDEDPPQANRVTETLSSEGGETLTHSESNENSFNTEKEEEESNLNATDTMFEDQLYGKGEDTTLLHAGIYCKSEAFAQAVTSSTNVNHLLRRFMAGVFKPSKIINCTVTGSTWHAGGEEHLKAAKNPLHPGALKAIVDFSNSIAKKKKWSTKKMDKAKQVFAIKLTEIKKQFKEGKLQD